MSQRKYMRSVARRNMEKAGFEKMNKKRRDNKGNIVDSKFSENWRDFVTKGLTLKRGDCRI